MCRTKGCKNVLCAPWQDCALIWRWGVPRGRGMCAPCLIWHEGGTVGLTWRWGMAGAGACWRRRGDVRWPPRTGTRWPRTGRAAAMPRSAAGSERRWSRARPPAASAPSRSTACRWNPGVPFGYSVKFCRISVSREVERAGVVHYSCEKGFIFCCSGATLAHRSFCSCSLLNFPWF